MWADLGEVWRLLVRDNAREEAGDERRQLELCRYMWWMRHLALASVLWVEIRDGTAGTGGRLTVAALLLGLAGHAVVVRRPGLGRRVTIADLTLLVFLAALGLPPAAVLLTSVAILGWAATFRPLATLGAYAGVLSACIATSMVQEVVPGRAALLGFCMLAGVFSIRMVRLNMEGRRAADRERLVEQRIDAVVWEEIPGVPDAFKVSAAAERVLGHPAQAWAVPGFWRTIVHPQDRAGLEQLMARREDGSATFRCRAAGGEIRWFESRVSRVADRAGRGAFLAGVLIDRTDIAEAEREALVFGQLVATSPIGQILLVCGDDGPLVEAANAASHRILGVGADVAGRPLGACGADAERVEQLQALLRPDAAATAGEFHGADGLIYQATVRHMDADTCSIDFLDVTERVAAGRLLHAQARQDDLTGLANRRAFLEAVDERLRAQPGRGAAVVVMDLDDFRNINDSLGHETGDRLLERIGARLAERVRDGDLLARLGGDEFAVLLTDAGPDAARLRADDLVRTVNTPVEVGQLRLRVRATAGVAAYPDDATDVTALMRRADAAMHVAKERGSEVERHRPGAERTALERLARSSELERAIADGQLTLRHQPLIDTAGGEIIGTEALVRWIHPDLGMVPPDEFIPLAEASGHIRELTRWVIARGLDDLRSLGDEGARLELSINLSVRNLYEADLLPWILSALATRGIAPGRLVLEITESVVMDNEAAAVEAIRAFREHGIRVWIDDFGTGHSSLARLRDLPVDGVKIDRSFVRDAATSPGDRTLLESLVALIGSLGLQAVAEGVEDEAVLRLLTDTGCPIAQGFHLGRPMPLADLRGTLLNRAAA